MRTGTPCNCEVTGPGHNTGPVLITVIKGGYYEYECLHEAFNMNYQSDSAWANEYWLYEGGNMVPEADIKVIEDAWLAVEAAEAARDAANPKPYRRWIWQKEIDGMVVRLRKVTWAVDAEPDKTPLRFGFALTSGTIETDYSKQLGES